MSEEIQKESREKPVKAAKKTSNIWILNTDGKPSITATFATVAFFATTCAYIMSLFESIGSVSFKAFDTAACSAYMIPILSLYFGRRWTDRVSKKEE
jgi:hypothetical protein